MPATNAKSISLALRRGHFLSTLQSVLLALGFTTLLPAVCLAEPAAAVLPLVEAGETRTCAAKEEGGERAKALPLPLLLPLLPKGVPNLVSHEWNRFEVIVAGEEATLAMGDQRSTVKHPHVHRAKGSARIGIALGSVALRQFDLHGK